MRFLPAVLLAALFAAGPSWSQATSPCSATTRIPVNFEVAPPVCPGQPLTLVARACAPCVDLTGWTFLPAGPVQVHATMNVANCILAVCMPESLAIPLGTFAAGHYVVMVEIRGTVTRGDGTTCDVVQFDEVAFDVPLSCETPAPLPYTDVIRIGPPPPCAACPPPPICPGDSIPFFISGRLPGSCYQFRAIELLPSPIVGPLPEPPIVRVKIAYNDCMGMPCTLQPEPWQAAAMLPPLPARTYSLIVELALVSWCDPTRPPDSLYSTIAPFTVAERCGVTPGPDCFLHSWRADPASATCDAHVGPGTPGRVTFQMWTGEPLAGLEGRFVLDPAALQVTGLRPVGIASGMQLSWNPRPDGAQFVLYSLDGHTIHSPCSPPAMCPPGPDPVLEVTVAPRPGVPIPPLTLLDVAALLGADTLGRAVQECPTFAAIPPARICAGRSCDFNSDGQLDVRDLVVMVRCITGRGPCPDSAASRFDCNGDGTLGLDDVLCCARVILRGHLPSSVASRPAPALYVSAGSPVATADGLDLPLHLSGADLVGAARLVLSYPADRFDRADVELLGGAASWLQVSEAADGELVLGLVATAPPEQVGGQLDLVVHFGLAAGQQATQDLGITQTEFVGPDGVPLEASSSPTGVTPGQARFELSPSRPNPFRGETSFVVGVAEASEADVAIFDLAGRRVTTLHRGTLPPGDHAFRWDGTDSGGAHVSGGVYFYRVVGAGASVTRSLVLLDAR